MVEPTGTRAFAPFEWMLSLRYLRARRKEGFISVIAGFSFLGIMLGVATLIIVMAVMNGFRKELLEKILGLNGHLLIQPLESPLTDWDAVAERIVEDLPASAWPRRSSRARRWPRRHSIPAASWCAACAPPTSASCRPSPTTSSRARWKASTRARACDRTTACRQLVAALGRNVTLVAPRGAVTPMGTTPRIKTYKVAGGVRDRHVGIRLGFLFMPLTEAQAYFNRAGDVTAIEVYIDNPDQVDMLPQARLPSGGRPIFMIDWRQRNATFFNALQVERNVMFLILTLIVLVAALNIVSGLIMLVKDKGADIAILRTMGATQGAIMRVFLITGASIGVVGTLVGFLLGS